MAAVTLDITQSGSGSSSISVETGDTITLELANTVNTLVLAQAKAGLVELGNVTGITFAINTAGGAT